MNRRQLLVAAVACAALVFTLVWGCNGCVTGPVPGTLTATPDSGHAPLQVLLSMDIGDLVADSDYDWLFGDGSQSRRTQEPETVYEYETAGTYEPVCQTSARRLEIRGTTTVHVSEPVAGFEVFISASEPAECPYPDSEVYPVSFESSVAGGTPPYTYAWDFSDGTPAASGEAPSHWYPILSEEQEYVVQLTVHDDQGESVLSNQLDIVVCGTGL